MLVLGGNMANRGLFAVQLFSQNVVAYADALSTW